MKVLKRLSALVAAMAIALTPVTPVMALETVSGADAAKQGVVQVNTVIVDENSEKSLVIGGTGFIIGDPEGTEYVITSKHIVNPDKETLGAACEHYGIVAGEDETTVNLKIATEVVIESDVVLNASILTSSNELDIVVLQLPQPIYTRTPLKLLTNKKYDVNNLPYAVDDSVYALGYPEMVKYDSETKYFSDEQVQMAFGEIKSLTSLNGVQVVESTATTDYNNYGGPLVNENGYVIGMNMPQHDGDFSCALDSTKIAKILDGLGVNYSQVNSAKKAEPEVEESEENVESADSDVESDVTAPTPVKKNKGLSETVIIVGSLVAVFLIACGVAGLILFVVNKDRGSKPKKEKSVKQEKKAKKAKTYNGPVFDMDTNPNNSIKMTGANTAQCNMAMPNMPGMQQTPNMPKAPSMPKMPSPQSAVVGETTILSAAPSNDGETSLLSEDLQAPQNLGTLVRKKTSEEISLNKSNFVLGKDAVQSDYCIDKNSSISRKHAMITSGRNGAYIQDCNSTNGTFINGTKLESERSVLLNSGDIVTLSNEEFEYRA